MPRNVFWRTSSTKDERKQANDGTAPCPSYSLSAVDRSAEDTSRSSRIPKPGFKQRLGSYKRQSSIFPSHGDAKPGALLNAWGGHECEGGIPANNQAGVMGSLCAADKKGSGSSDQDDGSSSGEAAANNKGQRTVGDKSCGQHGMLGRPLQRGNSDGVAYQASSDFATHRKAENEAGHRRALSFQESTPPKEGTGNIGKIQRDAFTGEYTFGALSSGGGEGRSTLTPEKQWAHKVLERRAVELSQKGRSASCSEAHGRCLESEAKLESSLRSLRDCGASREAQLSAAESVYQLSKLSVKFSPNVCSGGALRPLVDLLNSQEPFLEIPVVLTLVNLSRAGSGLHREILAAGAVEPLARILRAGKPPANENAAAALFNLSCVEESRPCIAGAHIVLSLLQMFREGSSRGRRDAGRALFSLTLDPEVAAHVMREGGVAALAASLGASDPCIEEMAVAGLSNLAKVKEGALAILQVDSVVSTLVEIIEGGSPRAKEDAAATLLLVCQRDSSLYQALAREGAIMPLVALSQEGRPRARSKARALLELHKLHRSSAV